tara:strand:- start:221 stop:445 length:225 start_codon:yes stop_codon:yes gene_type:complete
MSKMGSYLIEAEENGEIRYDDRQQRYIDKKSDLGGQYSFAKGSKARDRGKTSTGIKGSNGSDGCGSKFLYTDQS